MSTHSRNSHPTGQRKHKAPDLTFRAIGIPALAAALVRPVNEAARPAAKSVLSGKNLSDDGHDDGVADRSGN